MVTTVVIPRAGVVCAAIIRGVENIVRLLVDVDGGGSGNGSGTSSLLLSLYKI